MPVLPGRPIDTIARTRRHRARIIGTGGPARPSIADMEHWNEALRLIEDNLDSNIDVAALARVAQTSEYHFRRMFSTPLGLSLSEYVRRRRLTQATAEILDGDAGVLEVAVQYGYGSADAFHARLQGHARDDTVRGPAAGRGAPVATADELSPDDQRTQ
jgi:transcriptional regulator GlxA family with amidase domain